MYAYPKLESLGVRVRWTPWGRAFVWQGALNAAAFALKVDARRFKEAYRKTPGKCWVPGMEWAEVVEAALAAEGAMR